MVSLRGSVLWHIFTALTDAITGMFSRCSQPVDCRGVDGHMLPSPVALGEHQLWITRPAGVGHVVAATDLPSSLTTTDTHIQWTRYRWRWCLISLTSVTSDRCAGPCQSAGSGKRLPGPRSGPGNRSLVVYLWTGWICVPSNWNMCSWTKYSIVTCRYLTACCKPGA